MANFTIEIYHDMLCSLHCQSAAGVLTLAKPVMVLAMIEMVSKGIACDNRFYIDEMRVEYDKLREIFHVSTLHQYPLYFLEHESFYHLKWKCAQIKTYTPSAKFVRDNIEYAYLDNALWDLLQDEETRNFLKDSIINYYMK